MTRRAAASRAPSRARHDRAALLGVVLLGLTSGCASRVTKHTYSTELQHTRSTETVRENSLEVRRSPGFVHLRLGEAKFCVTSQRDLTVDIHEARSRPDYFWFAADIALAAVGGLLVMAREKTHERDRSISDAFIATVVIGGGVATAIDISKFGSEREEQVQSEHDHVVARRACGFEPRPDEPISLVTAAGLQHSLTDDHGRVSFQLDSSQAADVWVDKRPLFHVPAQPVPAQADPATPTDPATREPAGKQSEPLAAPDTTQPAPPTEAP